MYTYVSRICIIPIYFQTPAIPALMRVYIHIYHIIYTSNTKRTQFPKPPSALGIYMCRSTAAVE